MLLAAGTPASGDLCWCSDSGKAAASRAFGATLADIDFLRCDRVIAVVTVRPLLTARDAVAGRSVCATEMLKALRQEALRAFRKLLGSRQEARLARHAWKALFLLSA